MPIYVYQCDNCGHVHDEFRAVDNRNEPASCPLCHSSSIRDFTREVPNAQNDFTREVHSEALGIHPSQIAEATKKFPHHKYLSDGRMVIRNLQERNRIARDLGFDPG